MNKVRYIAVVAIGLACADPARVAPPGALTAAVTEGPLGFESSYYGELEARNSHPILAPELRGVWQVTIERVLADGTRVKKGETVLTFARGTFDEDLREREAELAVALASHQKTKEQLLDEGIGRQLSIQRAKMDVELSRLNLVEGVNLISKLELEKFQVELQRAELQLELKKKELVSFEKKRAATQEVERLKVEAAQQKVNDTRAQLSNIEVKAPADGVLYAPYTRLNWSMNKAAPGVVARPGDKILEIPELDLFNVSLYVRQRDATLLKVGDVAKVIPTMFPDRSIAGTVVSKEEFATTRNARTGTATEQGNLKEVKVVLELEKTELPLRPGGTVRADIATTLVEQAVQVPLAALKEGPGGFTALKASGERVKVKIGQTSTTHAQVLAGLEPGDVVLLDDLPAR